MKIGFIFSGQGAQIAGMGNEFLEYSETYRHSMDLASKVLGYNIIDIINDNEKLNQTQYTQPAVLAMSVSLMKMVKEELNLHPVLLAGLSLGEYTALVESGALSFEDALRVVQQRGQFMADAVPSGQGAMSAVIGLDRMIVEEICLGAQSKGLVIAANYNMPTQIAIAGTLVGVEEAELLLHEAGARRIIRLNVSGPFHTPLMKPASEKLKPILTSVAFQEMKIPVVTNVTGQILSKETDLVDNLMEQVMSPVYWEDSIRTMIENGVDTFIEIGPGKALSGFVKKIDKNVTVQNVDSLKSFDKLKKVLSQLED
ncbi:ACP S-malonyltransferase [Vagococcus vulneris]|uniref:Malonyl CoA-acyl carrier protein transacylase n=1 Tax=Vagococcus vulneris TaxID=1977869 RepID=A0A429ZZ68_9ENTE|nr:ACP S-malonyltransferase [Vagococcus vulneris]RST99293.1 [acyl-carrier-protein] S-malonyltransferase [Vagococcus vulneris]